MSDDPASRDGMRWEIRRSLIERLRIPWDAMGEMANQQRAEAAIQISTMMDEIEAWRQAMQKAERDIAQVRAERDEARRMICIMHTQAKYAAMRTRGQDTSAFKMIEDTLLNADELGWNCFKDKKFDVFKDWS